LDSKLNLDPDPVLYPHRGTRGTWSIEILRKKEERGKKSIIKFHLIVKAADLTAEK
jgi:hypothetical protein